MEYVFCGYSTDVAKLPYGFVRYTVTIAAVVPMQMNTGVRPNRIRRSR